MRLSPLIHIESVVPSADAAMALAAECFGSVEPTASYSIATPDEIRAVVAQSQKRSAVYDVITNPTNVTVEVN